MSRKDYVAIAAALNESYRTVLPEHRGATLDAMERIILALKADNPRFSTERFRQAVLGEFY